MEPVVELLQNLVRIPSVNPADVDEDFDSSNSIYGEDRIAKWLAIFLQEHGFLVTVDEVKPGRPNVIGWSRKPEQGEQAVCLCSHLDVVPVGSMTIPPFDAEIHNGSMWGRGTSDPKGSVAAMCMAAIAESKADAPPVLLLFTMDEEAGFTGAKHFAANDLPGISGAVIGEPTGLKMLTGHKGIYRTNINVSGKAAHASMPHLGINAVYRMASVVERVATYGDNLTRRQPNQLLGTGTVNVGIINGGVAFNSVPDSCTISIDRRTMPDESSEKITAELRAAFDDLEFAAEIEIEEPLLFAPGFATPEGKWLEHVEASLGQNVREAAPYATDGAVLQRAGIDCVIYGPGEMSTAHTEDEHIPIDQLVAAVDGYRSIIRGS